MSVFKKLFLFAILTTSVKAYSYEYYWLARALPRYGVVIIEALTRLLSPSSAADTYTRMTLYPLSRRLLPYSGTTSMLSPTSVNWSINRLMGARWPVDIRRHIQSETIIQQYEERRLRIVRTTGTERNNLRLPYLLNYGTSNGITLDWRIYGRRTSYSLTGSAFWPFSGSFRAFKVFEEDLTCCDPEGVVITPDLDALSEFILVTLVMDPLTEEECVPVGRSRVFESVERDAIPWNWNQEHPPPNQGIADLLVFLSQEQPASAERNMRYSPRFETYMTQCPSDNSTLFLIPYPVLIELGLLPGADPDNEQHLNPDQWKKGIP